MFAKHLAKFNDRLKVNNDKRVKIVEIARMDDFTDIPEGKMLLFLREAKIITASIYHKLEGRLNERNSAAHPSGVKITESMCRAYIDDLLQNVVLKYDY